MNTRTRLLTGPLVLAVVCALLWPLTASPAAAADKDCADFATQRAAQIYFLKKGGPALDPDRLDADSDGIACEGNPDPHYYGSTLPGDTSSAPKPPVRSSVRLTTTVTKAIHGERFRLRARVTPHIARVVVLQVRKGRHWVRIDRGRTTKAGVVRFGQRTRPSTTTYRVKVAAVKRGTKRYTAATSGLRSVRTLAQRGRLLVSTTSVEGTAPVTFTARFAPVRRGRPVALQMLRQGRWVEVRRGKESATGRVRWSRGHAASGNFTYRAVALPHDGAVRAASGRRVLVVTEPPDVTAPGVPTGLFAAPADGVVHLVWQGATAGDLDGYHVYRATSGAGPWTRLTTAPSALTSFDAAGLVNGTSYWFAVTSVDLTGNESARSATVSATPVAPDTDSPPVPTGLVATPGDAVVQLSWDSVVADDLSGYRVYSSASAGGPWTLLTGSEITALVYEASGLTNGVEYWFSVTSVDLVGNESALASEVSATPQAAAALTLASAGEVLGPGAP